jgi:hypothetical protein
MSTPTAVIRSQMMKILPPGREKKGLPVNIDSSMLLASCS